MGVKLHRSLEIGARQLELLMSFEADKFIFICLTLFIRLCRIELFIVCLVMTTFVCLAFCLESPEVVSSKSCRFIWGLSLVPWCVDDVSFLPLNLPVFPFCGLVCFWPWRAASERKGIAD